MANLFSVQGDEPVFAQAREGTILILTLIRDPTAANYASRQYEYNRIYKELDESPETDLLFDLTECVVLDSVTIGMLVSLTNVCRTRGRQSVLAGVSDDVGQMLSRLMLLQPDNKRAMWQCYATRDEALAAIRDTPPERAES